MSLPQNTPSESHRAILTAYLTSHLEVITNIWKSLCPKVNLELALTKPASPLTFSTHNVVPPTPQQLSKPQVHESFLTSSFSSFLISSQPWSPISFTFSVFPQSFQSSPSWPLFYSKHIASATKIAAPYVFQSIFYPLLVVYLEWHLKNRNMIMYSLNWMPFDDIPFSKENP